MKNKIRIGITFGDIAGIGPEIIFKALSSSKLKKNIEYVFFGDKKVFNQISKILPNKKITSQYFFASDSNLYNPEKFHVDEIIFNPGESSLLAAKAAVKWIEHAVYSFKQGLIDGIVTGPINKASCYSANFKFKGHTDFIASMFNNTFHKMAFYSKTLKVVLLNHHISLKDAISKINTKDVLDTIVIADNWMKKLKIVDPKIFIAGINPHAGEDGSIGKEELNILLPALKLAKNKNINVLGPISPDIVFRQAMNDSRAIVIAMHHDQGLIPFKLLSFNDGVNVTIGLPIIRTSPDHGTAYDIAWQGKASESSMIEAINLCVKLLKN